MNMKLVILSQRKMKEEKKGGEGVADIFEVFSTQEKVSFYN